MSCNWPPSFEIAPNVTYAAFEHIAEVCPATYIRPDPGGSMMPWLPTLLLLLFHLPACIIRAVRWESAQYLALGLALLGIALSTQAYVSTALKPGEVLVWMPVTLVLDVGAMEQMIILILEKHDERRPWVPRRAGWLPVRRGGRVLWDAVVSAWREMWEKMAGNLGVGGRREDVGEHNGVEIQGRRTSVLGQNGQSQSPTTDRQLSVPEVTFDHTNLLENFSHHSEINDQNNTVDVGAQLSRVEPSTFAFTSAATSTHRHSSASTRSQNASWKSPHRTSTSNPHPSALRYAFVLLTSTIFLLALLTLQIYGLHATITGLSHPTITVNWCSPAFRDFAVAVTTGNCQLYPVIDSSSNGIGCISLPGSQQRDWLRGTAIALCIALVSQTADWTLMMCTNSKSRWRGVKFQRPWLTMATGIIMLVVLIYSGRVNANELPRGVTETVWIYRIEGSRIVGRVCRGKMNSPGLRGVMIGYMDGLLGSWGGLYDGHS